MQKPKINGDFKRFTFPNMTTLTLGVDLKLWWQTDSHHILEQPSLINNCSMSLQSALYIRPPW